jgi:ribosomal protein S18 acetylase RimI-like enzyme
LLDLERVGELRELYLLLHAHHRSVIAVPLADDDTAWAARREEYVDQLVAGSGFGLVARRGESAIGYAFVVVSEGRDSTFALGEHHAELYSLVVLPSERGRGIGTALLDAVDAELDAVGIRGLVVAVMEGNDGALELYRRRGLVPAETYLYRFDTR